MSSVQKYSEATKDSTFEGLPKLSEYLEKQFIIKKIQVLTNNFGQEGAKVTIDLDGKEIVTYTQSGLLRDLKRMDLSKGSVAVKLTSGKSEKTGQIYHKFEDQV